MNKKIITMALISALGVMAFAQSTPKVLYSLSVGYMPSDSFGIDTPAKGVLPGSFGATELTNVITTDIYVGVQYYNFYLGGGSLTKMMNISGDVGKIAFNPFYNEYNLNLGWKFKNITIEYEHICGHPVTVWDNAAPVSGSYNFNKASDTISIKLSNF